MGKFDNAFITGASSGIGRAIAEELAARGARVVLAARREQELGVLRDEIASRGGRAEVCKLDVADSEAIEARLTEWDRKVGGFDLVLANAGVGGTQPAHKLTWPVAEKIFRINTLGAIATLVAALGPMSERGRGTLAAVTSLAGMRGLPRSAAYSASKAAVSTFLESLRTELASGDISVVDIRPGFVDTPLTQKNKFQMPFMIGAAEAARRSVDGLERGAAIVAYPWQLSVAMSVAESMPDSLWNTVARRIRI